MGMVMYKKTDEQLVAEVQTGRISSYEVLVRRFEKKLYHFIFRVVKREDDAKDIVQDAFISVYEHIDQIDVKRSFSAYLYSVAKNGAMTYFRKKHVSVSLEGLELIDEKHKPEDELIVKARNEAVHHAIESLGEKHKKVVRLYYFSDLSYEEIAKQLSLPLNTVRTYLRRAKMQLKSLLKHETH
jgi:RNA polymerase sigma factor (sigma-70 family)